jgi:DNA/RNA endonuclease YhcR with UshA esterase domain
MRTRSVWQMLGVVVMVLAVSTAFAQKPDTPAAAATSSASHSAMPKYDVAKEVTIKGTVEDVKEMTMGKGEAGVHLMVKTGTETIEVRLCPSGYLKDFEVAFSKGQQVEVTGSRVKVDDKEVILAREVVQGNNTVTLRDKQGGPVWTWLKKD